MLTNPFGRKNADVKSTPRAAAAAMAGFLIAASAGLDVFAAEHGAEPAQSAVAIQPGAAAADNAASLPAAIAENKDAGGRQADPPIDELLAGDKIQISFFEQLDLGQGAEAGMSADIRTFYQRLDLTGEHVVGADGSINIALLGRFDVGGMTADEARLKVMEAYRTTMGRTGEVNIKIVDRKPVFVTGIVKSPGSFRYEPGMIAAQAIALAGGYDRPAEAAARIFDAQREREKRAQAVNRLERLVAKRARLIRQRSLMEAPNGQSGADKIESSGDGISELMEAELRLLDAEMSARSAELSLNSAKLSSARERLNALRKISEIVARQISARSDRMRVLQKMQGSGVSTLEALWNAQKEVADLQIEEGKLTAEIGSAESSVVQAEAEAQNSMSDRIVGIERELTLIGEEIDQQRTAIDASEATILDLETSTSGARIGEPLQLKILRRTPVGTSVLNADESADLRPGDVVKVGVGSNDVNAPAAASSSL